MKDLDQHFQEFEAELAAIRTLLKAVLESHRVPATAHIGDKKDHVCDTCLHILFLEWLSTLESDTEDQMRDHVPRSECVEHEEEQINGPFCIFCGSTKSICTGSGFEDGVPAHDFTRS